MSRCESAKGKNNCEVISPGVVAEKCDKGYRRASNTHCVIRCPSGYIDGTYHCIKPRVRIQRRFKTYRDCKKGTRRECERHGGSGYFRMCKQGYVRTGKRLCIPMCPSGWFDEGVRCRKPYSHRQATPFLWTNGDQ
eukprot:TRINITY_DN48023_c0_g1_i1.p1 TRINITY_DN48023_c0_g1~~TRINITY_DN48023_c0_g1_i1.p1  ORF type:complete len:136 (-),score=8.53 TRINITY_DN48023_c0_g1_i1:23-430(-)